MGKLASFVVLALLILNFTTARAQESAAAEHLLTQTLIAAEKKLIAAKKIDDDALFQKMLSKDFILVAIDGQLHEKHEAIDELGDSDLLEITPYDMKVVPAGDGAAIVTYDAVVVEAPKEDEGPPPRYQHFSSVWVKRSGAWKLQFHQATAAHWGDW
jgi:hypothetical protein